MQNNILLINCADEKGLIYKITKVLYDEQLNIVGMKEYVDEQINEFFVRIEFLGECNFEKIKETLADILPKDAKIKVNSNARKKIVIYATKEHHCLSDIILRHYFGELNAEIMCVVANHNDLKNIVFKFDIPFYFVSHDNKSKEGFENELTEITNKYSPDYIVLAKFMRIISPEFVSKFENRIINIHHSFLPAFIGANPYRKAFERGVKLIGATAHFVTDNLDEGPIITQKTQSVDHSFSANDMRQLGKEVERMVLAEALQNVLEDRVFITGNKTVVFL